MKKIECLFLFWLIFISSSISRIFSNLDLSGLFQFFISVFVLLFKRFFNRHLKKANLSLNLYRFLNFLTKKGEKKGV